jgi:serralysin
VAIYEGSNGDDRKTGNYTLMDGGLGNDILNSTHPGEVKLLGGPGFDFVFIDYVKDPDTFGVIYGGPGDDVVYGGAGKDQLYGHSGDDYVVAHGHGTHLYGAEGRDALVGGAGANDLVINGGGGDDKGTITVHDQHRSPFSVQAGLFGSPGNDQLFGGGGDDLLVGGLGQDALHGGGGEDSFRFLATADSLPGSSHRDAIEDFDPSEHDRIDLSRIDANEGSSGDQDFKFIGSHHFHDRAGELRFSNGIVKGDTDGDGHPDIEIKIHITGPDVLGQHDFIL